METLHGATAGLVFLYMLLLAAGIAATKPHKASLTFPEDRKDLRALAALFAGHVFIVKPFLPHSIWHDQHAAGMILDIQNGLSIGGLDIIHGPAFSTLLGLLRIATFGLVSVFSLNYAVSLLAVFAFFLLVRTLTEKGGPALFAAALLLFLPAHMRLSVTESMALTSELFLLTSLWLFALFFKSEDERYFWLGILSSVLLVHTRTEMMLLGLASFGFFFFLLGGKNALFFLTRPRTLTGLAIAALMCAPRLAAIILYNDDRISQLRPESGWGHLKTLGLSGVNAFFNPEYTPIHYMLLAVTGALVLLKERKRLLGFLLAHIGIVGYVYAIHIFCVSLKIRTALATQFAFILPAAFGLYALSRRLNLRWTLLALAVAAAPLTQKVFLLKRYTQQQEYSFITLAARKIPPRAVLVYLSQEDDENILQNRGYQKELFSPPARAVGIWRFLESAHNIDLSRVFFYRGMYCHTQVWRKDETHHNARRPDYEHPLCRRMGTDFHLIPVLTRKITDDTLSWDTIEGSEREIGLYRIGRRDASRKALAGLVLPDARAYFEKNDPRAPVKFERWITRAARIRRILGKSAAHSVLMFSEAEAAEDADNALRLIDAYRDIIAPPSAVAAALRLSRHFPKSEPLLSKLALLYQDSGDFPSAVKTYDRILLLYPSSAETLTNRAVAHALSGNTDAALSDLRAALATGNAPPSALETLQALRERSGNY